MLYAILSKSDLKKISPKTKVESKRIRDIGVRLLHKNDGIEYVAIKLESDAGIFSQLAGIKIASFELDDSSIADWKRNDAKLLDGFNEAINFFENAHMEFEGFIDRLQYLSDDFIDFDSLVTSPLASFFEFTQLKEEAIVGLREKYKFTLH